MFNSCALCLENRTVSQSPFAAHVLSYAHKHVDCGQRVRCVRDPSGTLATPTQNLSLLTEAAIQWKEARAANSNA
ncbi:unnamed protein product, partial [Iphiclides podalirius]